MSSSGNDLVYLPATRPERTNLPRFYSRILTAAEVEGFGQLAPSGLPFDHYVWLCWSMKESVFKYQKRGCPELAFAPLRIEVRQIDPPTGDEDFYAGIIAGMPCNADTSGQTLHSRSWVRDGVITTVVSEDQYFTDTHWGFLAIDSPAHADQSAAVRTLALGELSAVLSRDDLRLEKDAAGCPIVVAGDRPLAIPISLAHHERYIAYSFLNNLV
ncbi:MAG TPA: 4'-phosphopantetheinyl transferase superfamily protein [Puia sp.]|nr:4'-phosphopantetheinyl transferase superfamily protein [Puia sp.]